MLKSFFEGRRKQLWLKHTFSICHFFLSLFVHAALRVKALAAVPILEVKECKLELGRFWSRSESRISFFPLMFSGWRSRLCFQSQCEEAGAGMC